MTLYGFCDASTKAYTTVVYLALRTNSGVVIRFVVSKTTVTPLQSQMIPCLEQLLTLLLSKVIVLVVDSLKFMLPTPEVRCYTNLQVALYWIQGTNKQWKPFVENTVNKICCNVHPSHWSHCPGKQNPADLPSRGHTALEVSVNQLWRQGPEWLCLSWTPCTDNPTIYARRMYHGTEAEGCSCFDTYKHCFKV